MNLKLSDLFDRREAWLAMALLMVAAFCLFANTFGNAWTYDDFPVIVDNPDVRSLGGFLANAYPGRPLREITYLLDHALFGLNPAGWHIQNIFWHGLNAGLLFLVVLRLGGGRLVAWVASLLFLVHPIQVEVVANISHRKDSLALAFCLLSLLACLEVFRPGPRRWAWLAAAAALWGAALLAKQNAVVLPAVVMAYELTFVPPQRRLLLRNRTLWLTAAVVAVAAGIAWYLFSGAQEIHRQKMTALLAYKMNYFDPVTWSVYYRMILKSWATMFSKLFFPVDLALEYTFAVPGSWIDPWVIGALTGVGLYVLGLAASFRRYPLVFVALAWLGAFWLPVSNLWPLAYMAADRYLYAPSVGLFIMAALLLCRLFRRPIPLGVAVLALAAVLSVLTWRQNRVWRSPETLWTQAYEVSPRSSFTLNNLGNIHLLKGELLKAEEFYGKAAAANPLNSTAHYNLGLIYERIGRQELALEHYRRFLAIDEPMYRPQAQALRQRLRREYGGEF